MKKEQIMKFDKENRTKLKRISKLNQNRFQGEQDKKELFRDLSAYPVNYSNDFQFRPKVVKILDQIHTVKRTLKMAVTADEDGNWQFTENLKADGDHQWQDDSDQLSKGRKYLQDDVITHLESSLINLK